MVLRAGGAPCSARQESVMGAFLRSMLEQGQHKRVLRVCLKLVVFLTVVVVPALEQNATWRLVVETGRSAGAPDLQRARRNRLDDVFFHGHAFSTGDLDQRGPRVRRRRSVHVAKLVVPNYDVAVDVVVG